MTVALIHRRPGLRTKSGRRVGERGLEEIAIDIRVCSRSRIGGIDDVYAALANRDPERHQLEVMMNQNASQTAHLQDFGAHFGPPLAELRQADAKLAQRMIEDVVHGDHRRNPPLGEVGVQPERVRQVLQIHSGVVVGKNRRQIDAREIVVQRVLDHRPQLSGLYIMATHLFYAGSSSPSW